MLNSISPRYTAASCYGCLESNVEFVSRLPIAGLYIDLSHEPGQPGNVLAAVKEALSVVS